MAHHGRDFFPKLGHGPQRGNIGLVQSPVLQAGNADVLGCLDGKKFYPVYFPFLRKRIRHLISNLQIVRNKSLVGIQVDIGFIDAVVLKIAVGILERKQKSEFGSFFRALGNRNQVVVRTHPDYRWQDTDLFDLVLDDLPREPKDYKADLKNQAFFAMDTLWLSTDRDRNCPDCCKISKRNNRKGVHRA